MQVSSKIEAAIEIVKQQSFKFHKIETKGLILLCFLLLKARMIYSNPLVQDSHQTAENYFGLLSVQFYFILYPSILYFKIRLI